MKVLLEPIDLYRPGCIATSFGKMIDVQNPNPELIDISDIATALNLAYRFNGHSDMTVAEHSVIVCTMAPEHLKWEALMHDAHEAYIGDIPSPIKHILPDYQRLEAKWTDVMCQRFLLDKEKLKEVAFYDRKALEQEFVENFCKLRYYSHQSFRLAFLDLFRKYAPEGVK